MISTSSHVSSYSVNATANPIRYHTTEARHLLATTLAGLDGNGIPSSHYGSRRDGKFILRGGDYLTPHARSVLPLHMGGESYVIPTTLDDRTVTFLYKVINTRPQLYSPAFHSCWPCLPKRTVIGLTVAGLPANHPRFPHSLFYPFFA